VHYVRPSSGPLKAGTVFRSFRSPEVTALPGGPAAVRTSDYPWCVVLTQDCDLQQDYLARRNLPVKPGGEPVRADKKLRNILVCPAFNLEEVEAGTYLEGASQWPSKLKSLLERNGAERFHVLPPWQPAIPVELALDFKLAVGCTPEYLYRFRRLSGAERNAVALLRIPFRDRLIQRYLNFAGRIAEP
jgi:hypothetical protein